MQISAWLSILPYLGHVITNELYIYIKIYLVVRLILVIIGHICCYIVKCTYYWANIYITTTSTITRANQKEKTLIGSDIAIFSPIITIAHALTMQHLRVQPCRFSQFSGDNDDFTYLNSAQSNRQLPGIYQGCYSLSLQNFPTDYFPLSSQS